MNGNRRDRRNAPQPERVQLPPTEIAVMVGQDAAGNNVVVLAVQIPMTPQAAMEIGSKLFTAGKQASSKLIVPDGAIGAREALEAFEAEQAKENGGQ